MDETLKIGLIGCGTVGEGVVRLLRSEGDEIQAKTGIRLELAKVADRDPARAAMAGLPEDRFTTDAGQLLSDPSIQVVV